MQIEPFGSQSVEMLVGLSAIGFGGLLWSSEAFPEMKQLEEPDHPWRREIAFARQVGALDEASGGG